MTDMTHQRLLIIDFGSQVTQLIARRLREASIYCEIHPYQKVSADSIRAFDPKAVILSGGPASVMEEGSPRALMNCSQWACHCWASVTANR